MKVVTWNFPGWGGGAAWKFTNAIRLDNTVMRRFEAFTAVRLQVESLCVVTPFYVVIGYRHSEGHAAFIFRVATPMPPFQCHPLHPEDGSNIALRNIVILPHGYTLSLPTINLIRIENLKSPTLNIQYQVEWGSYNCFVFLRYYTIWC